MNTTPYRGDYNKLVRLWDNVKFGCASMTHNDRKMVAGYDGQFGLNAGDFIPLNVGEQAADLGLWLLERFPKHAWKLIHEPRVAVLTITALAFGANSYLFYPKHTSEYLRLAIKHIPIPPQWTVKFAAYLTTSMFIVSFGTRALSRFSNEALARSFYGNYYEQVFQIGQKA
jgi:hypothetical protein